MGAIFSRQQQKCHPFALILTNMSIPIPIRSGQDARPFVLDEWLLRFQQWPQDQQQVLRRAGELAIKAHHNQKRASGDPYIHHVFSVADTLLELGLDYEAISAAILHDVVEDSAYTRDDIEEMFGEAVAGLVDGVTKMEVMYGYDPSDSGKGKKAWDSAESLRKMLLAMVEDVRVVLIKLADRLDNMRTLKYLPPEKQQRIARETHDIFAPLANRLGIWQIKWELEDLSLRYLEPEIYKKIARLLDERRSDREAYIVEVTEILRSELQRAGIEAEVSGRPKHIYSIWKKMKHKDVDFHEIFDVRAMRVLVNSVADCYAALGIVHTLWRHIAREFDDYITSPKGNNYQSLHTAVYGPQGKELEVQIRTREMHEHAELGVAAHWKYKEGSGRDEGFEKKIAWLRQLLDWNDEGDNAGDFIDRFKSEIFEDRVYVMTPRGNIVDLPKGATPLDFAYYIHTDIGHRCRGAKVGGKIVPLTYELRTGDHVEILTARNGIPSRDWLSPHLGYLKTSRARAKARSWFKHQDYEQNVIDGRQTFDREMHRLGISGLAHEKMVRHFRYEKPEDFFAALGRGEITSTQIAAALQDLLLPSSRDEPLLPEIGKKRGRDSSGDVRIHGVGNLLTKMARCCMPAPGDSIVGYITQGRGVTIHRADCANMLRLQTTAVDRLIEVSWEGSTDATYPVDIQVLAYDRQGLLRDITAVLSNEKVNVIAVNTRTDHKEHMANMRLTLEIGNTSQLSRLLSKIDQLSNVIEVKRSV